MSAHDPDLVPPEAEDAALAAAIETLRAALGQELAQAAAGAGPVRAQARPGPEAGRGEEAGPPGPAGDAGPEDRGARKGGPAGGGEAGRRILSVWLPDFPLERWMIAARRRGEVVAEEVPFALAAEGPHGPVVHAANRAAREAGVTAGMRLVDARALLPGLRADHADPGADRAALNRLMLWARRWCPWTAAEGERGLMLDATGSAHLWGGEAALLAEVEGRLGLLGLSARVALAPTQGAAWALARFGAPRTICTAGDLAARIAPLPVRALRLAPATVLLLQRLGLKTVGDLAAVPRISLARRFSRAPLPENPLLRLDQMTGRLPEPLAAPDDPPRFSVQVSLAEPILDPSPHLPALAAELCEGLAAAGFGARRLALALYRTDGEVVGTEVATSRASRDPRHLVRLFEGRLERVDPGFGFDLVTLSAAVAERLAPAQPGLDRQGGEAAELAALIDRLAARFGPRALVRPRPGQSHMPERAATSVPALAGAPTGGAGREAAPEAPEARPPRPLRLFDPPEEVRVIYAVPEGPPAQFVWRRVTHRVTRFAGPERIAPEWWADRPGTRLRDYYRIEDQEGRRFWLYREGVMGDGRGETPRWFVHGAFG